MNQSRIQRKTIRTVPKMKSILFADVAGFSKIEADVVIPFFVEYVIQPIGDRLRAYKSNTHINTWGDAIFALFDSPVECCRFALEVRDLFHRDFTHEGLPKNLSMRLAIHQGIVSLFDDQVWGINTALGHEIVLCARIEPLVRPGQILATEQIKLSCQSEGIEDIVFDDVGCVSLPKDYGSRKLFHMRWSNDPKPNGFQTKIDQSPLQLRDYADKMKYMQIASIYKDIIEQVEDNKVRNQLFELYQLAVS